MQGNWEKIAAAGLYAKKVSMRSPDITLCVFDGVATRDTGLARRHEEMNGMGYVLRKELNDCLIRNRWSVLQTLRQSMATIPGAHVAVHNLK